MGPCFYLPPLSLEPRREEANHVGLEPQAPGPGVAGRGRAEGRQHRLRSKLRKCHPLPPPSPHLPEEISDT